MDRKTLDIPIKNFQGNDNACSNEEFDILKIPSGVQTPEIQEETPNKFDNKMFESTPDRLSALLNNQKFEAEYLVPKKPENGSGDPSHKMSSKKPVKSIKSSSNSFPKISVQDVNSEFDSGLEHENGNHKKMDLSLGIELSDTNEGKTHSNDMYFDGIESFDESKLLDETQDNYETEGTFMASHSDDREMIFVDTELKEIGEKIGMALALRDKYINISLQNEADNPKNQRNWVIYPSPPPPAWKNFLESNVLKREEFDFNKVQVPKPIEAAYTLDETGIYKVYIKNKDTDEKCSLTNIPTITEFYKDFDFLMEMVADGPTRSLAFRRLKYLEVKFQMHLHLNEWHEKAESRRVPHRDFYNVRKVDTHVHLSSCMNQKHLLRFIKFKIKTEADKKVIIRDEKWLTLRQVFESLNLTAYEISIDTLDMHANTDSFHRFDKFNLKYNPIGESRLRNIFLKTDNEIGGKYFAQLTKEVLTDLEASKYQMAEYRVSIYGHSIDEWEKLADWVIGHKVISDNVRWLIQVPRLYHIYKASEKVSNFEEIIRNIFEPLFKVTQDPCSNPKLHAFLQRVIGFDSVDDESKVERRPDGVIPEPRAWDSKVNPPYSYYCYYTYANMTSLNQFRKQRGFNTFVFRPHSGEAGDVDHLASAFLTAQGISHGILLRKAPLLQYLYYLKQIGVAMSPLSNNALFLSYERNPLLSYFQRGLNISLSTDDPLQFHYTKEPLIEEYSVAAQIYKFSGVDMCELALNSVIQSGFEATLKRHWIGRHYLEKNTFQVNKTNVPETRINYRKETLFRENLFINNLSKHGKMSP
ncbi:hypothetical protein BB559_005411 [Furculomyces boomerangus]|uniref:AMP deaminase n=2 Tax=Harpellales TaxID=61421 RepID=A0A2T9XWU3_9FUNG|nr:hypothetical protein BB559_007569 [Furculomyces boomerangus]PVU84551.1 hypothetical protein BB559_007582 [Furculomyces boomerangus]PVU88756.1 hypothetical protein BB559_005411 [Furculomyces boomerangus]PWA02382.1 hypothetical protein BB558_001468 [Smittium angustum]